MRYILEAFAFALALSIALIAVSGSKGRSSRDDAVLQALIHSVAIAHEKIDRLEHRQ